jgi:tetratricopeptide (TPR) repeat protein
MNARVLLAATLALLLAGCDATADGRQAWRAGDAQGALAAFRRAVDAAGDSASPEVLYDLALAALRVGDLDLAEQAASRAAARGGAAFEGLRDFVRGSVSFARSEAAEAEAGKPGADATAWERATLHTEDALARWRMAAASRWDWPEARRNVERALLRLDRLREKRRDGGGSKPPPGTTPGGKPAPDGPVEPPDAPPLPPPAQPPTALPSDDTPKPDGAAVESGLLSGEQVLRLFDALLEKERQKQALRRAVRAAPTPGVERDW